MGCHLVGFKMPYPDLTDTASNIAGELKRVCFKHPTADPELRKKLNSFVRNWVERNIVPLDISDDVSFSTWLKSTKYTDRRKKELEKVWAAFNGDLSDRDKCCKAFSKAESYSGFKHLRGINSRSDVFKCAVAPIFSAIEKALFKMKWFIKKIPVSDRASHVLERLGSPTASFYATDYSAFESHFDPQLMEEVEFVLYEYATHALPEGEGWFNVVKSVIGAANTCIRKGYVARGITSRMSGEMCTSLGNSFANLMVFLFVCSEAGIEEGDIDGFVEGDDGLFKFERHQKIDDNLFARLGLTIKIQKFEKLWEASFCGLVFDPDQLIVITDPLEVLADFGWASNPCYVHCGNVRLLELLRAKSMSFAHQYPGCPIVQSLAQYGLRMTRRICLWKFLNNQKINMWDREQYLQAWDAYVNSKPIPVREISASTRALVESNYGISAHDQIRIEQYIDAKDDLSPIDIGDLPNAPDSWREMWATYVMPSQGDYPSFVSRIDYDNVGDLLVYRENEDKHSVVPEGKALLINRDRTANATLKFRPRFEA